jgi:hypothetical protein
VKDFSQRDRNTTLEFLIGLLFPHISSLEKRGSFTDFFFIYPITQLAAFPNLVVLSLSTDSFKQVLLESYRIKVIVHSKIQKDRFF